jgi:hypothetical protein
MTTTNNAPISFRLTDEELELLRQHQEDGEKSLNLTAKRLLLSALGVDAKKPSLQIVNTVDTNQIKELIETAVQEKLTELTTVDNVDIFKKLIDESLADGGIGEAIASSYTAMMGQFNGLLEELQDLKSQLQELKSIPPAPVPQSPITNEELTIDNGQSQDNVTTAPEEIETELLEGEDSDANILPPSPMTDDQLRIIQLLGIDEIKDLALSAPLLNKYQIGENIKNNQDGIEAIIQKPIDKKCGIVRRVGNILKAANFDVGGNEKQGYFIK